MSPCVSSLRGTTWDSSSFFHWLNPHWFLQPKLWGFIFLALEPWVGRPSVGLGLLALEISLLNFYPPHMSVGPAYSSSMPLLPVWMDVVSLIPWLSDFHSTWLWQLWMMFALYFSCNFDVVVQRGKPHLPAQSSWAEAPRFFSILRDVIIEDLLELPPNSKVISIV